MNRPVIVVNDDFAGTRFAIPMKNIAKAHQWVGDYIFRVLLKFEKEYALRVTTFDDRVIPLTEENEWELFPERSFLIENDEMGKLWVRIFITEEGEEGVYLGFDSGSRDNYTAPLPIEEGHEDDGYGDADAYLFHTVGKPVGKVVEVTEVR